MPTATLPPPPAPSSRALPPLSCGGVALDPSPAAFGELRRSDDVARDPAALRARFAEDGYLYLPGYLDREEVLGVRAEVAATLAAEGALDPGRAAAEMVARAGLDSVFRPDLASAGPRMKALVYGPRVLGLYEGLYGEPVRHFDYTWVRAVAPGKGTGPHVDNVYMGRGTSRLATAWVPYGDVPLEVGGLIVLEGSHRAREVREDYGVLDVDRVCENRGAGANEVEARGYQPTGAMDVDADALRRRLGGRWLTAEYRAGDLLTFSMFTLHASLDNRSDRIRLSSDTRYQPAGEPADERWVGDAPPAHGEASKRGLIC